MGGARSETASISFTGVGDGRCVFGSGRRDPWNYRTAREHAERRVRTVVRNGYAYQIEARGRTRRVSGTLTIAESPRRSRTSQRQAGGTERRASDDGGHYIAVRFDGPTDAFNHFAQDRHFNRGATVCSRMNGRGTSVSDGR
ncbi:DNA/RNA non-specific endonuclease [Sphingomonas beigongshangi]|uniref:DNA/RNA non-specific endonuclease n=1 Tax=Sphingomonas beigongshangi TaxID=2782540 RepID=UPI0030B83DFB